MYNISHHMDKVIAKGEVLSPHHTTHVWLANDGLKCDEKAATLTISFAELREELIGMRELVRQIVEELPALITKHLEAMQAQREPTTNP